jgi:hypothetical protein
MHQKCNVPGPAAQVYSRRAMLGVNFTISGCLSQIRYAFWFVHFLLSLSKLRSKCHKTFAMMIRISRCARLL